VLEPYQRNLGKLAVVKAAAGVVAGVAVDAVDAADIVVVVVAAGKTEEAQQ
jgi:hypothetical protein